MRAQKVVPVIWDKGFRLSTPSQEMLSRWLIASMFFSIVELFLLECLLWSSAMNVFISESGSDGISSYIYTQALFFVVPCKTIYH